MGSNPTPGVGASGQTSFHALFLSFVGLSLAWKGWIYGYEERLGRYRSYTPTSFLKVLLDSFNRIYL
ncbi:MAG: hypothetical protein QXT14_03115 [Candidatus Bathyarchaeia archaeon]